MGITASADVEKLQRFLHSSESIKSKLLIAAATESKALVQLGFRNEMDPSGTPWEPLKYRKGKILQKTRRMMNSFNSEATENGFRVGTPVYYTIFHQDGTTKIPKRAMVPGGGQLTEKWRQVIDKAMISTMNRLIAEAGGKS